MPPSTPPPRRSTSSFAGTCARLRTAAPTPTRSRASAIPAIDEATRLRAWTGPEPHGRTGGATAERLSLFSPSAKAGHQLDPETHERPFRYFERGRDRRASGSRQQEGAVPAIGDRGLPPHRPAGKGDR